MDPRPTTSRIAAHILSRLPTRSPLTRPLFIALQGPQGSGKTYLTSRLSTYLSSPPHNLSLATLSLDDLYLPHQQLRALKERYPLNRLLAGRGLPGTHDLELGVRILQGLRDINDDGSRNEVLLPTFEKSLHNGEGDRLPPSPTHSAKGPLDVILMEGWCMGFSAIASDELDERWEERVGGEMKRWCAVEHVREVNEMLKGYEALWAFFDVFVRIIPSPPPSPTPSLDPHDPTSPYAIIYKWRLQQEHYMKAHNGGMGMSDEQVVSFVDRYIPGYIFFSDGITRGPSVTTITQKNTPQWIGKSLRITIGEEREFVGEEVF